MNFFQNILLVIFGFAMIIGLLIFAGILPGFKGSDSGAAGEFVIWGTFTKVEFEPIMKVFNDQYKKSFTITYKSFDREDLEGELIDALASGEGPDLVIAPHELIFKHTNKLQTIPTKSLTLRKYQDTFFDGASLFITSKGYLALPILVDPMVMYYNKDIYSNAGFATVPKNWSAFISASERLSVVDKANNVTQSFVPMGTFSNIENAKDILSLLFLQSGNRVIERGERNYRVVLSQQGSDGVGMPAARAISFFLQFSDPFKVTYSWNRSLPVASKAFASGFAVNYFGLASELPLIQRTNPHLNFDAMVVPQGEGSNRATFGRIYGVAITKNTTRPEGAYQVATILSSESIQQILSQASGLMPTNRTLLSQTEQDPYRQIFKDSAIISRAWPDPSYNETKEIFRKMVEDVATGKSEASRAVTQGAQELSRLFLD